MKEETTKLYEWAEWVTTTNRSYFNKELCGVCNTPAFHIAIADDEDNAVCIKARCEKHFNRATQKTWLKNWRKTHLIN